ncbi:MAG: HAMP domain-containing histidine kinase [Chloroflexi bacterium]|nr:HAMP domain-containing histidine kinase [Chloroflexota bacterium]
MTAPNAAPDLTALSLAAMNLSATGDLDAALAALLPLAGAQRASLWLQDEHSPTPGLYLSRSAGGSAPAADLSAFAGAVLGAPEGISAGGRIAVPLRTGGQVLGALCLERAGAGQFRASDLATAQMLAASIALALHSARLEAALAQAQQSKSQFVSVVTHELRIPMTSILGYTDLLRQGLVGPVNDQQLGFLNTVRNNVERMSALVADLADIARIESGRLKLDFGVFSPGAAVNDAAHSLRARLEDKQQEVQVSIAPGLPRAYADRARTVQALTNLLSNASKYTPPQGRIFVEARMEGEMLWIGVRDEGIGVAPEDQERVFEPFFRSEAPEVREQQGWGLGLSVARRLVEAMGGAAGINSTLGQGSLFWITLPCETQDGDESA